MTLVYVIFCNDDPKEAVIDDLDTANKRLAHLKAEHLKNRKHQVGAMNWSSDEDNGLAAGYWHIRDIPVFQMNKVAEHSPSKISLSL